MPTTEQVREGYSIDPEDEYRDPINAPANRRANERYFDRWLAERIREAKAEGVAAAQDRLVNRDQFSERTLRLLDELAAEYRSGTTTEGNRDE
jgi:hypothetical protein